MKTARNQPSADAGTLPALAPDAAPSAADELPTFAPIMLRGLTYSEVLQQMRVTGCAGRRNHWCSPVIVYEGTRLIFDNEDQRDPWKPTTADRKARDWEMTERPQ